MTFWSLTTHQIFEVLYYENILQVKGHANYCVRGINLILSIPFVQEKTFHVRFNVIITIMHNWIIWIWIYSHNVYMSYGKTLKYICFYYYKWLIHIWYLSLVSVWSRIFSTIRAVYCTNFIWFLPDQPLFAVMFYHPGSWDSKGYVFYR